MLRKPMTSLFLAFLATACAGTQEHSKTQSGGSGVNNGPGPLRDYLGCNGSVEGIDVSLEIRSTAVPTFIDGLLTLGQQHVGMACRRGQNVNNAAPDAQVNLWTCAEDRNGDGLYRVSAYKQANSTVILADVTIDQIFPLEPQHVATLTCRIP